MKKELQLRLVRFSTAMINVSPDLTQCYASDHLGKQLSRSSSSAALNFGEAQHAESPADFIHKLSVCLKELRESETNLMIIEDAKLYRGKNLGLYLDECRQLIAIFYSSLKTIKKNQMNK